MLFTSQVFVDFKCWIFSQLTDHRQPNPTNRQNQYYYYGGDAGQLTDITLSQADVQPQFQQENIREEEESTQILSSKQIEESLINNDALPTSPLLIYNSTNNDTNYNNTYCLPVKEISINTELHVSTACISMQIVFDNTCNYSINDINTLFCFIK